MCNVCIYSDCKYIIHVWKKKEDICLLPYVTHTYLILVVTSLFKLSAQSQDEHNFAGVLKKGSLFMWFFFKESIFILKESCGSVKAASSAGSASVPALVDIVKSCWIMLNLQKSGTGASGASGARASDSNGATAPFWACYSGAVLTQESTCSATYSQLFTTTRAEFFSNSRFFYIVKQNAGPRCFSCILFYHKAGISLAPKLTGLDTAYLTE